MACVGQEATALLDEYVVRQADVFNRLQKIPLTLVHGDLRADNLLIDNDDLNNSEITIVDWQIATISAGAIDVAFLILGSEPAAERHGHFKNLVSYCHLKLVSLGVKDYSFSEPIILLEWLRWRVFLFPSRRSRSWVDLI